MSTKHASETPNSSASTSIKASDLVMQLIVDESILREPEWTMGPMMAQAAHATSAIIAQTFNDAKTQAYLSESNMQNMRKIVLKTAKGVSLQDLSRKLDEARSASPDTISEHHLWIEQPENIPTVLAIAPNTRPAALKKVLNKCSLLKS